MDQGGQRDEQQAGEVFQFHVHSLYGQNYFGAVTRASLPRPQRDVCSILHARASTSEDEPKQELVTQN